MTEETRGEQGVPHKETLEQASAEKSGRAPVAAAVAANGHASNGHGRNGHANGTALADAPKGKNQNGQNSGKRPRGSGGTKGAPNAVKKLMWTGLVTGSIAGGALVARRASAEIWRGIFHEDPPTKNV